MSKTKEELMSAVNNMVIYDKDYTIIQNLLNTGDSKFIVKILEEIVDGNLYWSDFESVFGEDNGYQNYLKNNIPAQVDLENKLQELIKFRQALDSNYVYDNETTNIGLVGTEFTSENEITLEGYETEILKLTDLFPNGISYNIVSAYVDKHSDYSKISLLNNYLKYKKLKIDHDFYEQEYTKMRKDVLYTLTQSTESDTELQKACKLRLYNALNNGELLYKNFADYYGKTKDNMTFDGINLINNNTKVNYEYLDPNALLLSIEKSILPLTTEDIVLDATDRDFASYYSLDDDSLKKFKALALFLRRQDYYKAQKEKIKK